MENVYVTDWKVMFPCASCGEEFEAAILSDGMPMMTIYCDTCTWAQDWIEKIKEQ